MIDIMFLLALCLMISTSHRVNGMNSTLKEDLELERQLKLINKPPIKSIQTKFGYIVDCIDIDKQPAFDHPLLKNHKLQRQPNFSIKKEKTSVKISPTKPRFGLDKIICPTGTVPIRRTTKYDLIRAKSLWNNNILAKNARFDPIAEVALIKNPALHYYGISGTTSVYNPKCSIAQSSTTHIFIQNGEGDGANKIMVGWHVFPHVYGDDKTHLYAAWTSDNFKKTGCYNVQCQGFVQTGNHHHLGEVIPNISVYGGPMVEMTVSISQEFKTNSWVVTIDDKPLGYFPAALFTNFKSADRAGWGGGTIAIGVPSPPMGSGLLPDEDFNHSGYFRNVAYKNESGSSQNIGPDEVEVEEFNDAPKCYGVDYYGKQKDPFGYSLQFGGPGGNCAA